MLVFVLIISIIAIVTRIRRLVIAIRAKQDLRGEILFFAITLLIIAGLIYLVREEFMTFLRTGKLFQ